MALFLKLCQQLVGLFRDSVSRLLGRDLAKLGGKGEGYLQKAQRRGLGTMDWQSLNPKKVKV